VQDSRFVITSFPEFSAGNEKVSRAKRRGQSNGLCHDAYLHHKRSFQNMEENNFGDFCGGATFDRKVAIHNIWAYFSVHPWIGGTCGILSSSTRTPPS
jgi:hypothetical protein